MKFSPFPFLAFVLVGCVLASTRLNAQSPSTSPDDKYRTDTTWPELSFAIVKIIRMDAQNVLMIIKVGATATAPPYTFLGSWPDGKNYKLNDKGNKIPAQPIPYSMMDAVAFDEITKIEYKPVPQQVAVGKPFYGFSQVITSVHPKEWFQMSLQFPLPVPPPNPDGTIPVQKVDVTIPNAKGPIKAVVVPPVANK